MFSASDRSLDSMQKSPAVIPDRPIRIAVVGCGRISANHFKAIEAHRNDLHLAGVCDSDPQVLEAAAREYGVKGYPSLRELLENDVDGVARCPPGGFPPSQAILAARAGFHVITEKPRATRGSAGLRMVGEGDAAGVPLLVVKKNRRNSTLQLLKRAVEGR